MADGLSLAASIIAVIDITAKVVSGSYGYISSVVRAPDDLKKLVNELQSFTTVLITLQICAHDNPGSAALQQLDNPLLECMLEMKKFQAKLASNKDKWWARLKWSFGEKETLDFTSRIERLKSSFNVAINAEQLSRSKVIEADIKDIKACQLEEDLLKAAEKRKKTLKWLYPEPFNVRHLEVSGRRQKNTGQWILRAPEVQGLIMGQNPQLLWGYGIPGAGKTFLSSVVIDYLLEQAEKTHYGVAYIYFDFNEQDQQQPERCLASLVKQLVCQIQHLPKEIEELYDTLGSKQKSPTLEELYTALFVVAKQFPKTFIICDALDECDLKSQRTRLLPLFHRMGGDGMKLFLTSRDYPEDIQDSLHNSAKLRLFAKEEDIASYVERKIDENHRAKRLMDGNCKKKIISELIDCAKGMFLLVRFHIEYLCQQTTVRKILAELEGLKHSSREAGPLDPTYSRAMTILWSQPRGCVELAFKTLSWLVNARRTLTVRELQLAVSVEQDNTTFDEEDLPDRKTLLDTCASLVTIDEESDTIRLAHYTVQEYLVDNSIIPQDADLKIAIACLTFLSYDIFAQGACDSWDYRDRRYRYPFINYAASHLSYHISLCDEASTVEFVLKFLRSPGSIASYFQATQSNYYPNPHRHPPTSLHLAIFLGYTSAVQLLLEETTDNINIEDGNGQTVLDILVSRGQTAVVEVLLDYGADTSGVDVWGNTVLHNAVNRGQESMVRLLLDSGADTSSIDAQGNTALHNAVKRRQESMVHLLVDKGADLNIPIANDVGCSALHNAAGDGDEPMVLLLLKRGADISVINNFGHTALHMAANKGHRPVVQLLLEKGADISARDYYGETALHRAAYEGHGPVVQLLLNEGADMLALDICGWTSLHMAAAQGYKPVVQLMLERATDQDISITSHDGETALHWAAIGGHESVVHLLLDKGADILALDTRGWTPLHTAAAQGYESVAQLMLDKLADLDIFVTNNYEWPVLYWARSEEHRLVVKLLLKSSMDTYLEMALPWAVKMGHWSVFQILLGKGADTSTADTFGKTALHWAVIRGHEPMIQLLLDKGADISIVDIRGQTALHCAAIKGHEPVIQLLLDKGADISVADTRGKTALHCAAIKGHEPVAHLLLENGADISTRDNYGGTVLHWAARMGHRSIVELLFGNYGADISVTDDDGRTALHWVAETGQEPIAELLLDNGADISITNNYGQTALDSASINGHLSIALKLLDASANISVTGYLGDTAMV